MIKIITFLLFFLTSCIITPKPVPDRLVLKRTNFAAMAGWREDRLSEVIPVFLRSCAKIAALPDNAPLLPEGVAGSAGDWKNPCKAAEGLHGKSDQEVRSFFERWFVPFLVMNDAKEEGLFTGYHEIDLHGSYTRSPRYNEPLYRLSPTTVSKPVYTRQQINDGALIGKNLELLYLDDPVESFFLHIQGSGRVRFEDGSVVRVGYADQNGHPYFAIGRCLIETGELDKKNISARAIKDWLYRHKDKAKALMEKNPSYVFFRIIEGEGPIGAQGVPLTAERSLAVDKRFLSYGLPLWLETAYPETPASERRPFRKLMIAQDTGGAIRGPVRGDIFFGNGDKPEMLAEYMKEKGRYTVLVPAPIAEKVFAAYGR